LKDRKGLNAELIENAEFIEEKEEQNAEAPRTQGPGKGREPFPGMG
jgi:hypothetical protein